MLSGEKQLILITSLYLFYFSSCVRLQVNKPLQMCWHRKHSDISTALAGLIQFLALPKTFCAGLKNKQIFSAIQFLICKIIIKLGDEWLFSVQQPNCQIK